VRKNKNGRKNKTAQVPVREFLRRPPENFGLPIYFAGAFEVEGVVVWVPFLLCFFTAFLPVVVVLVAGAGLEAGAAGVCAIEMPAVASARENPRIVEVIFFMMLYPVLLRGRFLTASVHTDAGDY
jgi:hypothetical protein